MSAALAYHFDDDDYLGAANDNVARPSRFTVIEGLCPLQPLRVYDAAGRLVHVDEVGGGETDYLHGVGQTLARIKDGEFTYLHPDHLGSPQVGTNEAGAIAFNEYYTPFGEALVNAAANDNQSGFTGHIKDKSTGLNYMQARYYDPNSGRFLSIDPVTFLDTGHPGMFNRYAYTLNDPVNLTDPNGECPICIPIAIFIIKEIAAEGASQATGGATDFLSVRRTGTKAAKFAGKKIVKSTKELRGRKSFKDATATNKANNGGKCEYCSTNEATAGDHIKPLNDFKKDVNTGKMTKAEAKDVANRADNNAAACTSCNSTRHVKSLGDGPNDFTPPKPNDRIKDIMKDN